MESAVEPPRVLILDEDRFFSEGLRRMLEADGIPVLSEFADGVDRAASAVEAAPDLVVLGVGSTAGGKALAGISRDAPSARIVVVGVSEERVEILELLAAGAAAYLRRDSRVEDLVATIRLAVGGYAVLSSELARSLAGNVIAREQTLAKSPVAAALTPRELEVIRLMSEGADNPAIGRALSISAHTVKQHVTRIFTKLGVQNRVQAAVTAVRAGLV